jgi:hypothetical protein
MNCRQGDFAMVVKSGNPENLGKLVYCIRSCGIGTIRTAIDTVFTDDIWEVDQTLLAWNNKPVTKVPDSHLRPIRGNNGVDESFTWAPARKEK